MDTSDPRYCDPQLLIGGEWAGGAGRAAVPVTNPATGTVIAQLPCASDADLDRAVDAAASAFSRWRAAEPAERAAIMHRAAALLRERREAIATMLTIEEGKPIGEARDEVEFSAGIMDFFAEEGLRVYGRVAPASPTRRATLLLQEPIGPVAAFTPWNYPATVPARKISAALAAGCTMVIKPAEEAPASAVAVARALVDAGLPAGVLNMVFGEPSAISEHLIAAPEIRKVSFTGSTTVGRRIARLASEGVKPCMLELGGHAPVIICEDADLDRAAELAVSSKFHNSGQSCGAPSRIYVHESRYERFARGFAELTAKLQVGDGLDPGTDVGPLASERRIAAMERLVADARACGAVVTAGGRPMSRNGYFFEPTVLVGVPDTALIMHEEPFGPVAALSPYSSLDEVIRLANQLPYGLCSYVFTASLDTATTISRQIEAGMVAINSFDLGGDVDTFFGGVKQSGYGSDGGPEALREYLQTKLISQP